MITKRLLKMLPNAAATAFRVRVSQWEAGPRKAPLPKKLRLKIPTLSICILLNLVTILVLDIKSIALGSIDLVLGINKQTKN